MFRELLKPYRAANRFLQPRLPAKEEEIVRAEAELGVLFPAELRALLLEMNGDGWLFFSVEEIVRDHLELHALLAEELPGIKELLCFAGNGCGDYYAYQIREGKAVSGLIVRWDHELDQQTPVAKDIPGLIRRYYSDEI